jgi:hypothetical protein
MNLDGGGRGEWRHLFACLECILVEPAVSNPTTPPPPPWDDIGTPPRTSLTLLSEPAVSTTLSQNRSLSFTPLPPPHCTLPSRLSLCTSECNSQADNVNTKERSEPRFVVDVEIAGTDTHSTGITLKQVLCNTVVMASGLTKPNAPAGVIGIEHTIGYEDLPETGQSFEGQAVLVLGNGNAAFETANELAPYVNFVHVVPGRLQPEVTRASRLCKTFLPTPTTALSGSSQMSTSGRRHYLR